MTSRWFGTLLIAATALTPLSALQAQDGFGAEIMAQGRAAAIAATSGGIHSVDVPASNLRVTPAIPATDSAEFQRGERGNRGGRGGGGGGGGHSGRGGGGWGSPSASPSPAPAPAPAPQANSGWRSRGDGNTGGGGGYRARPDNGGNPGGGAYRTRVDNDGGVARQPRAERPANAPVARGNWASRRTEGNRYQPPVATPAPSPADSGRWQGRGGYRQGDTNSGYTRGTEERRGTTERRGDGGFGNRVVRNAERANGGNRYDNDRRYDGNRNDGNRYEGRNRDNDRRYDGNRWDRRDNDRSHGTRYGNNGYAGWDRSWRNDRRYDWQSHRTRYNSYYRMPHYYSPYRDWSYRRLSIGFSLWPLFYSERYWINDPWDYRLPDVYGPYRWVRYYDDALLVDVTSGEVVDVIENFFW